MKVKARVSFLAGGKKAQERWSDGQQITQTMKTCYVSIREDAEAARQALKIPQQG